jgi:hypothetical protein
VTLRAGSLFYRLYEDFPRIRTHLQHLAPRASRLCGSSHATSYLAACPALLVRIAHSSLGFYCGINGFCNFTSGAGPAGDGETLLFGNEFPTLLVRYRSRPARPGPPPKRIAGSLRDTSCELSYRPMFRPHPTRAAAAQPNDLGRQSCR